MTGPGDRRGLRWLDAVAVGTGLIAVIALIALAPGPAGDIEPLPRPAPLPVYDEATPPPPDSAIWLHVPSPPQLPARILEGQDPLEIAVTLPDGLHHAELAVFGEPLDDNPHGGLLRLPRERLTWGLNVIPMTGSDRAGRPVDRAWPLLIGDTTEAGAWIEPAVAVVMGREGFIDDDDLDDDLSAIARGQVTSALALIPTLEAGPISVSNFRAARTVVEIVPETFGPESEGDDGRAPGGGLSVHVELRRVHVDVDIGPVRISAMRINRLWIDARLRVDADAQGRPRLRLGEIEPNIDMVRRTEGVGNWLADNFAWFLEITGELLAEGPLRDAVTGVLDQALTRWVSSVTIESAPPLNEARIQVDYRFAHIEVSDEGLAAALDVHMACDDGAGGPLGRLAWPYPVGNAPASMAWPDEADGHPLRVTLTADAANGVLHALWRCGALDTSVAFEEAHADLPLFVPSRISTRFELPPVFQPVGDEPGLGVGVGGLRARVDYGDAAYDVAVVGRLPVELDSTSGGRALRVGFDPAARDIALYTDCLAKDDAPCVDNVVFDRLAWLAMPFLPPAGAELPIPDVRLPDATLRLRLSPVDFDPILGTLSIGVAYEAD